MKDTLYLGIDWHKKTSAWVLLDTKRKVVWERKKVPCTPEGIRQAHNSMPYHNKIMKGTLEPVCGWRWATEMLEEMGVHMKIANPLKLRSIADSSTKNDRTDAYTLADILRGDLLPESYKCEHDILSLRNYVRTRGYLVSLRTGVKCRIHAFCTQKGEHLTTDKPLHLEGRKILTEQGDVIILRMFKVLDDLSKQINILETQMKKLIKENDTIRLLMSVPGVGFVTATSICAEVGNFSRFPNPKALINYAGLNPRERSSGERQRLGRISKEGSKLLRYTMVECALRVRDMNASKNLYAFYSNLKETNKKPPMVARVALARKMLSIMWYLINRQELYNDTLLASAQRRDYPVHVT
jgi:transposase